MNKYKIAGITFVSLILSIIPGAIIVHSLMILGINFFLFAAFRGNELPVLIINAIIFLVVSSLVFIKTRSFLMTKFDSEQ
ncbi:MAG TPA: hypothetical protein DCX27_10980 [Balneola sp.]|nr:hypothetical protein [Balneola sp.]HAW80175.1 hypothetical protein [Balneola sp.]|tara:strand:+ start:886 stop:1125 length:240 start_codon:yes stop_codon:yes gene_type:complete